MPLKDFEDAVFITPCGVSRSQGKSSCFEHHDRPRKINDKETERKHKTGTVLRVLQAQFAEQEQEKEKARKLRVSGLVISVQRKHKGKKNNKRMKKESREGGKLANTAEETN